jgi:hypothetical protein
MAILGDALYVMGGYVYFSTPKTAERYDSKTNEWSSIANMNMARLGASATALNGNMNIMKQEGIRTKSVAKLVHNVEVMSVYHHANVLGVMAIRSCKNAPFSFAMFVCQFASDNSKTVHFHEISYCKFLQKYVDRFQFLLKSNSNNGHFTQVCACVLESGRLCRESPCGESTAICANNSWSPWYHLYRPRKYY